MHFHRFPRIQQQKELYLLGGKRRYNPRQKPFNMEFIFNHHLLKILLISLDYLAMTVSHFVYIQNDITDLWQINCFMVQSFKSKQYRKYFNINGESRCYVRVLSYVHEAQ
jgi:hypothetical protein